MSRDEPVGRNHGGRADARAEQDPLLAALAALPTHDVDPLRAARTRARAHTELADAERRQRRRLRRREVGRAVAEGVSPWVRYGEPALVGAVALIYLGWAFSAVGRLLGG